MLGELASEVWAALMTREPYFAAKSGLPVEHIPRGTLSEAEGSARSARARLRRLHAIEQGQLSRTERLTVRFLDHVLRDDAEEPERWWSSFGVTPYTVSAQLSATPELIFPRMPLQSASDRECYLSLVSDVTGCVDGLRERILALAERDWRIPLPALPTVRMTLEGFSASLPKSLIPDAVRAGSFRKHLENHVQRQLVPAFSRLLEALGSEYERLAPEGVGLSQFPGGSDAYVRWVRYHLSIEADPDQIHALGVSEVERLSAQMTELRRTAFDWSADERSFHEQLRADARAKCSSPEALEALYRRHLRRMQSQLPVLIRQVPRSQPMLARLKPELEAGMTYGYYDPPNTPGEPGTYYYSAFGLENRLQLNAAPLMFHELVPGHHIQFARQLENERLPEMRRRTVLFSAFNEGWAEYSAGLGEEMGALDDPYDLYGWLVHQRFAAQRLVVDTGLNWKGWSLETARQYMAANTLEAAPQIASETVRYSTDLPAQALAYRMGFIQFRRLREKARELLADAFTLPDFHEAILSEGCLPLSALAQSVEEWAEMRQASSGAQI